MSRQWAQQKAARWPQQFGAVGCLVGCGISQTRMLGHQGQRMQKDRFDRAKNFIAADIERESRLARLETSFWRRLLRCTLRYPIGGGIFLAALGLGMDID